MIEFTHEMDPENLEQDYPVVPKGWYKAIIEDSDFGRNKKNTGNLLTLSYQIIDHPHFSGHKIRNYVSHGHEDKKTRNIASQTLNSILIAIGYKESVLSDHEVLRNIPIEIEVGIRDGGEYGKQNIVKKHRAITTGQKPAVSQDQGVKEHAPAPAAPAKQAWE